MAALAGLLVVSVASAGSNQGKGNGGQSHEEIVNFWTAERIASAKPRDISRGPGTDRVPSAKPDNPGGGNGNGNGGGGGGGGDDAVGGASWNGNGLIQSTTGKILFSIGANYYVCSGTAVTDGTIGGDSLILTAGHCVYDESGDGAFVTNFAFMPDFDNSSTGSALDCDSTPYGCWTAKAMVTSSAWATAGDFDDDYAFVVVGNGGHNGSTSLEATVGVQGIAFNQTHPTAVYAFGYPHASPYDGTDLTYCSGTDIDDPYGFTTYGLKCDMTGGSSGGGWYIDFNESTGSGTLTSLNSYKYSRGRYSSYMFGPYFDDYTQATYQAAIGASSNTTVNAP